LGENIAELEREEAEKASRKAAVRDLQRFRTRLAAIAQMEADAATVLRRYPDTHEVVDSLLREQVRRVLDATDSDRDLAALGFDPGEGL